MFGVLIDRSDAFTIRTYNVHSGTHTHSHPVKGTVIGDIWTHGECLRFAVAESGSITTWEVGFASRNTPTEVESLPLPDNFSYNKYLSNALHPTLSRFAYTHSDSKRVLVWDARNSKFLLNEYVDSPHGISFSSNGRFFMCRTGPFQIYLWKESPTGYILHRTLNWEFGFHGQLMSPNGESIFLFGFEAIQLSLTMDPSTSFSRKQDHTEFIVGFSPDETLAAVARSWGKTITVLDLKSGDPLSIIDAGIEVYGQGVTGSTVVAVNREKVVTWDLSARDHVLNTEANVNDNTQTMISIICPETQYLGYTYMSISPDLHTVAMVEYGLDSCSYSLHLHDVPTERCLGDVRMSGEGYGRPWFISDGRQVWCVTDRGEANRFMIAEGSEFGVTELEQLGPTDQPPNTPPWLSSRGYQIMDDRWILGVSGKRLLQLPPHWRSSDKNRTWSGRFLALSHSTLPEAIILELEE
ncbi:hypothetical protein BDM02DRAFT_3124824 [Thelephora ganbajun]|uniref:Uncharacterized protein n=1 Tax=Thelephora ganbajun TaxID=370292 RepID=A0ACB6YXE2_THEGA|nr:hypothetical protein BDM02DRAFT_3124824 [Thelephora ganbajun]